MDKSRVALTLSMVAVVSVGLAAIVAVRARSQPKPKAVDKSAEVDRVRARGGSGAATARLLEIGAASAVDKSDFEFLFNVLKSPRQTAAAEADAAGQSADRSIDSTDQLVLQRHAMVLLAFHLKESPDPVLVTRFLSVATEFLENEQWRLRKRAILALSEAGLMNRPEVRALVEGKTNDPEWRVSEAAQKVLAGS